MSRPLLAFVTVWTLKRGTLQVPEPLSDRNNVLANISLRCHELEYCKSLLAAVEKISPPKRRPRREVFVSWKPGMRKAA
jgi:hypothetical protein